jgi:thioredoxin
VKFKRLRPQDHRWRADCWQWDQEAAMPILTCPNCGTKNRVQDRAGMKPVCGKCGTELGAADSVVEVTDENFAQVIRSAGDKPVLVDCWAPWCGPCRRIAPIVEELGAESGGRWIIGKLNVDENPAAASRFQISSIPGMLIFHQGQLVDQVVGLQPKTALLSRLERAAMV